MTSPSPPVVPFVPTPVESIAPTVSRLRDTFATLKTYPLSFREEQLRKLYWGIKDNEQGLVQALKADIGKPETESMAAEIGWLLGDILYVLENLKRWAADENAEVPIFLRILISARVRKEPLGTVLVIGPYNFPLQLSLVPLVGVIAAGNTAIVKPSEQTPNTAALIARIIEDYLDPSAYAVVNGAIPETTELLNQRFDKICYTGSANVGRIIATAAAKHLTPVLLELGGLNPCLVTESAGAKLAGTRIAWGKCHNSGQICIAPDYALVHPSVEAEFVGSYIQALNRFFPEGATKSPDLSRIVNNRHFHRIKGLLENTKGTVLYGGEMDESRCFIAPTLVKVTDPEDSLLSEEIFGPVLPMLVVEDLDKMIALARKIGECPLGLYIFSNVKKDQEKALMHLRSGGSTINDVLFHAAIPTISFGGVGESGTGAYRGKASFDSFIHRRPVVNQPSWIEGKLSARYPPYGAKKRKQLGKSSGTSKPNFGRDGKLLSRCPIASLLLLGAKSKRNAALRYITLVLGVALVKSFTGILDTKK